MNTFRKGGCPTCGIAVLVFGQKLLDPLAEPLLSQGFNEDDPVRRRVYLDHTCRDADAEAYAERVEQVVLKLQVIRASLDEPSLEVLSHAQEQLQRHRSSLQELTVTHLMTRECSKCGARLAERCHNLTARRGGRLQFTANPHPQRLPELSSVEGQVLLAQREAVGSSQLLLEKLEEALASAKALDRLISLARALP